MCSEFHFECVPASSFALFCMKHHHVAAAPPPLPTMSSVFQRVLFPPGLIFSIATNMGSREDQIKRKATDIHLGR